MFLGAADLHRLQFQDLEVKGLQGLALRVALGPEFRVRGAGFGLGFDISLQVCAAGLRP